MKNVEISYCASVETGKIIIKELQMKMMKALMLRNDAMFDFDLV